MLAVRAWYDEIKDYDFKKPQFKDGERQTGHFTALIWKVKNLLTKIPCRNVTALEWE